MTDCLNLPRRYREQLEALLRQHVPGVEVWAYGSRVSGDSHEGSDLDLVLRSPTLEPLGGEYLDLIEALEESNIPILIQAYDWARLPESFHREIEQGYMDLQDQVDLTAEGHWSKVSLGEAVTVRSGYAFKSRDWTSEGVPVVKIANVKDGNLAMESCSFVSEETAARAGDFKLKDGDLLIAMTGYVGDVAIVRSYNLPAVLNQRVGRFTIHDPNKLLQPFLFYLLRARDVRAEIEGLGYGSAQPNISPTLIQSVEVPLPPLAEQRAIAHILGTLDDKIELNRRMNQTLEEMARALFKSWFVDFDPVRAKTALKQNARRHHSAPIGEPSSNGFAPTAEWTVERARAYLTGLGPQIAELFPDRLVPSSLGEIPEGWSVIPAGRAVSVLGGSTPSTKEPSYWEGEHCFATPKDLSTLQEPILASTTRRLTDAGVARISSGLLPSGTVLLSSRAPIGYLALTNMPTAINQGIIAMVCNGPIGAPYTLNWTRTNMPAIEDRASGTTFAEISKTSFREIPFLVPPASTHAVWKSIAVPLYDLVASTQQQSRVIGAQRDTMLPKLLSGELSVDHPS